LAALLLAITPGIRKLVETAMSLALDTNTFTYYVPTAFPSKGE
jgi:hypothetical protein